MPSTGAPPRMPAKPTTGAGLARRASRIPGTARIGPIETTGLLGATRIRSAAAIASATPGAGRADSMPTRVIASASGCGAQPDPVLLEVHRPAAARRLVVGDGDVGLDPVVGHRQQPQLGLVRPASAVVSAAVTSDSG